MSGGLVPLKTNATPSGTLFGAGGGGGGGGGTDIVVSSITINSAGLGGQYFPYNITSTTSIGVGSAGNLIIANQQGGLLPVLTSGAQVNTGEIQLSGLTGDFGSRIQARVGADGQGNVQISSLYVSSINGAVPGGGVPAQIAVSSIELASQGYIEMFQNNANESARIIGYGDIGNASSISLGVSFVPNYQSKVNGTDGLWTIENDAFGANQAFGDFGAGRFVVLGNGASVGKAPPVLDSAGGGDLAVNASGPVNISTTAFTVNGSPVGGGAYPIPSTILTGETIGVGIPVSTLTNLFSVPTIANHMYQITAEIQMRELTQAFTPSDVLQLTLGTGDNAISFTENLLVNLSTMYGSALITAGNVGGSMMFKTTTNVITIDAYQNSANPISTNVVQVYATDFGPST